MQVGIEEVVYAQRYNMDRETARVLEEGGVRLRQFTPERSGLVVIGEEMNSWMVNGEGLEDEKALVKMKDEVARQE